jgi:hypothetical protein
MRGEDEAMRGEGMELRLDVVPTESRTVRRGGERCDACGEPMQSMGHCKWLCRCCGFLRTCIDTV